MLHPFDGADGWRAFLAVQFRPVLDNALREAIGHHDNPAQARIDSIRALPPGLQALGGTSARSSAPRNEVRDPARRIVGPAVPPGLPAGGA
jgi:hypothetical protein